MADWQKHANSQAQTVHVFLPPSHFKVMSSIKQAKDTEYQCFKAIFYKLIIRVQTQK
jgi:hypothetical protein